MSKITLFIGLIFCSLAKADVVFDSMSKEFASLEEVEKNFHVTAETLIARKDPRGAFVKVYEVVTHNIKEMLEQNYFENPQWVRHVGLIYANYFRRSFFAYQVYQNSGFLTSTLSSSWWLAFSENKQDQLALPVQLILSVNAHIQGDLPQALVESGADFSKKCLRDYNRIGDVFARSFEESWEAVYRIDGEERSDFEELLGAGLADNWIEIFREKAWDNGVKLSSKKISISEVDQQAYQSGLGFRSLDFWVH